MSVPCVLEAEGANNLGCQRSWGHCLSPSCDCLCQNKSSTQSSHPFFAPNKPTDSQQVAIPTRDATDNLLTTTNCSCPFVTPRSKPPVEALQAYGTRPQRGKRHLQRYEWSTSKRCLFWFGFGDSFSPFYRARDHWSGCWSDVQGSRSRYAPTCMGQKPHPS